MAGKRHFIKKLFQDSKDFVDSEVWVKGWIRSVRKSKSFCFIVLNDGTSQNNLQIIADQDLPNYEEISAMIAGFSVAIKGKVVESGGKGQSIELQAKEVEIIGTVDQEYPLQKKATSYEFLREQAHLRSRTQTFGAVARISHALSLATHQFFDERGLYFLRSPIVTAQDAEGAGEMFRVTALDMKSPPKGKEGNIDYSEDYFGRETFLSVTGQLEAEAYAMGLGGVYTFGPTFRSENSNTARHLAEFWMVEPEIAFAHLEDVADLAEDYVKHLIGYALDHCKDELDFLNFRPRVKGGKLGESPNAKEGYLEILEHVRNSEFKRITYTEAVEILGKADKKFEFPTNWGDELQTEHERYLTEIHFRAPVIVTDYPKEFKAFYMKQNPDGKTVRAMDLLVPGVGELIGGSEREEKLQPLLAMMEEKGMDQTPLNWYLDLRRWGSCPHGGFGLGFERAVMYVTGMSNIRDAIPFPRTPKSADY